MGLLLHFPNSGSWIGQDTEAQRGCFLFYFLMPKGCFIGAFVFTVHLKAPTVHIPRRNPVVLKKQMGGSQELPQSSAGTSRPDPISCVWASLYQPGAAFPRRVCLLWLSGLSSVPISKLSNLPDCPAFKISKASKCILGISPFSLLEHMHEGLFASQNNKRSFKWLKFLVDCTYMPMSDKYK